MKIENSFTCPLAHCVILTWYAGGLLFFASSRLNHRQHPGVIRSAAVAYAGFFVTNGEVRPFLGGGEQIEGTKNMARRSSGNDIQR